MGEWGCPCVTAKPGLGLGTAGGEKELGGKKKNATHKGEWGCPRITGEPGMGLGAVVGGGAQSPPAPSHGGERASCQRGQAGSRREAQVGFQSINRALETLGRINTVSISRLRNNSKKKSSEGRYLNIIKEREGEREPASVGLVLTCCRPAAGVNHSQPPSCISGCFSL